MKILFENITEYNKKEINKFQDFHAKINIPHVINMFGLLILLIVLTIINIIEKNWKWLISVAVFGGLLFCYFGIYKKQKDQIHNIKVSNKKFKFDFYDRYISAKDIKAVKEKESIVNYFEIKKVYETEENFYLYIGENNSLVLNKNSFTIGKLEDFRKFIKGKCIFKYRKKYVLNTESRKDKRFKNNKNKRKSKAEITRENKK